jgi:hypothetical protein
MTYEEIGAAVGVPASTVGHWKRKEGWMRPPEALRRRPIPRKGRCAVGGSGRRLQSPFRSLCCRNEEFVEQAPRRVMARSLQKGIAKSKRGRGKQPVPRKVAPDDERTFQPDHVAAVLARAQESGLTLGKGGRIAGRVSPELIERAKARTGLRSDTELVEFALANIAIEDRFAQVFRALKATVDPDLDLGF